MRSVAVTGANRTAPPGGWRAILVPLVLALAARAAYQVAYAGSPLAGVYRVDQTYYRSWGLRIAGGDLAGSGVFEQGPLYAYLLGGWFRLFGAGERWLFVAQAAAGVAAVLLVHWCARRSFGPREAQVAGVLAAVYGPLVFYECMLMKTFLEPLLVLTALAASLRGLDGGRRRWFAAAGFAVGAACLVREAHALLALPLLLAAWDARGSGGAGGVRRAVAAACALLAGFAAALAPAVARNWLVAGEAVAVSSAGGENFYLGFGPYADGAYARPEFVSAIPWREHEDFREEALLRTGRRLSRGESSRYWLGEALRTVLADPARAVGLVGRKALALLGDREIPDSEHYGVARGFMPPLAALPTFGWIAGPGLLGAVLALRRGGASRLAAGFATALALAVVLTFNLGRYRAGLAGVWLVLAGAGWCWLADALRGRLPGRWRRWVAVAVLIASAGSFLPLSRAAAVRAGREDESYRREILSAAAAVARIPDLASVAGAHPADPAALYELGTAFERAGRLDEAGQAYREALAVAPAAVGPRWKLAGLALLRGDLEGAAGHARVLLAQHQAEAGRRVLLGTVLVRQALQSADPASAAGRIREALAMLSGAVLLDDGNAEAHYQLGRALHITGDLAAAARELERALEIRPDYPEARYLRRVVAASVG